MARSAQPAITDSSVATADWNSFRQSIGPPGAVLGAKATPVAEIATRVTERFGRTNGYLSPPRATSPATSTIFYTPLEREAIGRLWRLCRSMTTQNRDHWTEIFNQNQQDWRKVFQCEFKYQQIFPMRGARSSPCDDLRFLPTRPHRSDAHTLGPTLRPIARFSESPPRRLWPSLR